MKKNSSCLFMRIFITLNALCVLACSSCGSGNSTAFSPIMAQELTQSLERSIKELEIPGAAMAVRAPDGSTWFGASGCAALSSQAMATGSNLPCDLAMSTDLHFRIASATKAFTGTMILQLVDEGKLALDETLDQIMAQWFPPDYFGVTILYSNVMTLRNLLSMRSGMVEYAGTKEFSEVMAQVPPQYLAPRDIIRMSVQSPDAAAYAPDTRMEYCNTNIALLAIIIEQVTGHAYADEMNARVITPLGLTHTSVPTTTDMPAPYAHGYLFADGMVRDATSTFHPSWAWGAGDLVSTVGDMLLWVKALNEGSLISPAIQEERMKMQEGVIEGWPVSYGLAIYNDNGAVGHYGNFANFYTAYPMRYRGYDIVVLENGELSAHHEAGRHPARSIFWNAVRDIGIME